MRIVVDSNVWISALVFGGNPRKLFERAVQEGWELIVSEELLTEVRRNLGGKFPDFLPDLDALLAALDRHIVRVKLGAITIEASRDPDDNKVLETAVIGRAGYIVSGDKDLLVLKEYKSTSIQTPAGFLEQVK